MDDELAGNVVGGGCVRADGLAASGSDRQGGEARDGDKDGGNG